MAGQPHCKSCAGARSHFVAVEKVRRRSWFIGASETPPATETKNELIEATTSEGRRWVFFLGQCIAKESEDRCVALDEASGFNMKHCGLVATSATMIHQSKSFQCTPIAR
jgi:hypothetical protein